MITGASTPSVPAVVRATSNLIRARAMARAVTIQAASPSSTRPARVRNIPTVIGGKSTSRNTLPTAW